MKDIYELIRQKEADLERIGREIEALRLSARLLEESERTASAGSSTSPAPAAAFGSPAPRPQSSTPTPSAWASAKQFP